MKRVILNNIEIVDQVYKQQSNNLACVWYGGFLIVVHYHFIWFVPMKNCKKIIDKLLEHKPDHPLLYRVAI